MIDTSSRRRGPGRPKGGQVVADRKQLLEAATEVIRAQGPDATMDDIAAGASVTKPILYRTIGDKAALVSALAESLIDDLNRAVRDAGRAAPNPRAAFEAAILAYIVGVDADRNLYLFVNSSAPGTEEFRRLVDRSSAAMISGFSTARSRVGLDPDGAAAWAWAIVGALQIVATMWLRDDGRRLDELAHDLSELLWSGLGATLDVPRRDTT
jgi:AcrR family transcriptional regulator